MEEIKSIRISELKDVTVVKRQALVTPSYSISNFFCMWQASFRQFF